MARICWFTFGVLFFLLGTSEVGLATGGDDSLRFVWQNGQMDQRARFNAINTYYERTTYYQPDSVLALTDYHYQLAQQKNVPSEMKKARKAFARALCVVGEFDSALVVLEELALQFEEEGDSINLARIHNNIGTIYYYQNRYQEAVRYYSWSLGTLEKEGMDTARADVLNNLGLIYYEIKNYDLALKYLEDARVLYEEVQVTGRRGNIWLNFASIYYKQGECEKAREYIDRSLPIFQGEQNLASVADCYHLRAQCFRLNGAVDSAFYYAEKSYALNSQVGALGNAILDKLTLAELTFLTDVDGALEMGEELLEMEGGLPRVDLWMDLYKLLYRCYKQKGQPAKALEMHEEYVRYGDSLRLEEDNIAVIAEAIETEYEIRLHESELAYERERAELELSQLKRTFAIILIGVVLILIVVVIARSRVMASKRQRDQLLAEIERLKNEGNAALPVEANVFKLDREKIEVAIEKQLNPTDWNVLSLLLDDPVISNKDIAEQVHMSVDGIGSSLRRMYTYFEIKESKYKKISLIMEAIKISNR